MQSPSQTSSWNLSASSTVGVFPTALGNEISFSKLAAVRTPLACRNEINQKFLLDTVLSVHSRGIGNYNAVCRVFDLLVSGNALKWESTESEAGRFICCATGQLLDNGEFAGQKMRGHELALHQQLHPSSTTEAGPAKHSSPGTSRTYPASPSSTQKKSDPPPSCSIANTAVMV